MNQTLLPLDTYRDRLEDYRRHLADLRDRKYEGHVERAGRETTFTHATELLSPVVHQVLDEFNEVMLDNTGEIEWRPVHSDGDGGLISLWLLSWPLQRKARQRSGGYWDQDSEPMQPQFLRESPLNAIEPIVIQTFLPKEGVVGWLHGHIAGRHYSPNNMWPLQVTTEEDALRQAIVLWMIAEGELHRCVYDMSHEPMTILPKVVQ
jgi:hypothetical protein